MAILKELEKLSKEERAVFKAREIAKTGFLPRRKVEDLEIEVMNMEQEENVLSVYARVWDADGQMAFGRKGNVDIERFRIVNPPILVPDGTRNPKGDGGVGRSNYKEDPVQAVLLVVAHAAKIASKGIARGKIEKGKIGSTTDTFFPSLDGRRYRAGAGIDESFTDIRSGADTGGSNSETDSFVPSIKATTTSGQYGTNAGMTRAYFTFNTAAIPDSNVISSATFSWKTDVNTGDDLGCALGLSSWNGTEGYALANWGSTQFCSNFAFASINTDGATYNNISLNASGIAAINKSGDTLLGFRLSNDIQNVAPTWVSGGENRTKVFWSEYSGSTTDDPKLTVVHDVGTITKSCDETVTLVDTITKQSSRSLGEVITLVADFTGLRTIPVVLNEAVVLVDTLVKQASRSFSEVVTLVDTFFKQVSRSFSESVTLVAAVTIVRNIYTSLSERLTITDRFRPLLNGVLAWWTDKYEQGTAAWEDKYPE